MIGPARVAPPTAPIELPMPTMGKRRLPCSSVYVSAAKLQNCATVTVLKTPTHRKNGMPSGTPRVPREPKTRQIHGEEEGHERDECDAADTRREPPIEARHENEQHGLTGRCVALYRSATAEQDERLARDLQQVVSSENQEDVQSEKEDRGRLPRPHLPKRAQEEFHGMLPETQAYSRCLGKDNHRRRTAGQATGACTNGATSSFAPLSSCSESSVAEALHAALLGQELARRAACLLRCITISAETQPRRLHAGPACPGRAVCDRGRAAAHCFRFLPATGRGPPRRERNRSRCGAS